MSYQTHLKLCLCHQRSVAKKSNSNNYRILKPISVKFKQCACDTKVLKMIDNGKIIKNVKMQIRF